MNRNEYRQIRQLIRANGRYALQWLTADELVVMEALLAEQDSTDQLAERADIVAYCKREGLECNPRQTA